MRSGVEVDTIEQWNKYYEQKVMVKERITYERPITEEFVDVDDPNIVWAKSTGTKYLFSEDDVNVETIVSTESSLPVVILELAEEKKLDLFKLDSQGNIIRLDSVGLERQINSRDTIEVLSPGQHQYETKIIDNTVDRSALKGLYVEQEWFFDQLTKEFYSRIVRLAIDRDYYDDAGNFRGNGRIFELELPTDNGVFPIDPKNPDVIWAKRTFTRFDFLETKGHSSGANYNIKSLRKKIPQLIVEGINDSTIEAYTIKPEIHLSQKEAERIYTKKYTYDTRDGSVGTVLENPLKKVDLFNEILVEQEWYFDTNKMKLYSRVVSIAPIVTIYDKEGNYLSHQAYVKVKY